MPALERPHAAPLLPWILATVVSSTGLSLAAIEPATGRPEVGAPGQLTLFYINIRERQLLRLTEGQEPLVVVDQSGSDAPDGIAVDGENGHLYWTNMGRAKESDGFILRSNLDGSAVTTIIEPGLTHTPKQLQVDLASRKLYWSDREGMRVQRANLDGSGLETLVTVAKGAEARKDAANHCVGLALDLEGGYFYWSQKGAKDERRGSIRRASLDLPAGETAESRSDIEILFDHLPEPIDLEVDPSGGYLYWADRGDDTINRAPLAAPVNKNAGSQRERQILVRGVREAIGITLDLEHGHLYYTGLGGQLGRALLDGRQARDLLDDQGALVGITLAYLPHNHPKSTNGIPSR